MFCFILYFLKHTICRLRNFMFGSLLDYMNVMIFVYSKTVIWMGPHRSVPIQLIKTTYYSIFRNLGTNISYVILCRLFDFNGSSLASSHSVYNIKQTCPTYYIYFVSFNGSSLARSHSIASINQSKRWNIFQNCWIQWDRAVVFPFRWCLFHYFVLLNKYIFRRRTQPMWSAVPSLSTRFQQT